jgi:glutathione synthase/RimK-type ligase-like ATP-grasp enzyme
MPWGVLGRPATHSQGKYAIRSCDEEDLEQDTTSAYWSQYLPKQKEYRVYCFFGRVVAVAEKVPTDPNAIVWNHHGGGSVFKNVRWGDWPLDVCLEALKAQDVMNIDFTGVDVMVYNDKPYVLELNSAPSLSSPYRKEVFAKAFEYTFKEIEIAGMALSWPIPERAESYKTLIHPALNTL